jgi:hypothetical protein
MSAENLEKLKKDCEKVAVFPDGEIYSIDDIPSWKSDDYELRYQGFCTVCDSTIDPHWGEPIASCECFAQEWLI